MSLENTVIMNELYDHYHSLLTKKQQDMLTLYYGEDLSLSEISEHYDISRQGVRDNIKRGEQALLDYEEKLQLYHKKQLRLAYLEDLKQFQTEETCLNIIQALIDLEE